MRLHSDHITRDNVLEAARRAGATVEKLTEHGSRTRRYAFEVTLSGDSSRWANDGQYGAASFKAASWDQWGIVLAYLYGKDDDLIVGSPGRPTYQDAGHFHNVTLRRYDPGTGVLHVGDDRYHANHAWNRNAVHPEWGYGVQACTCGAMRDWSA